MGRKALKGAALWMSLLIVMLPFYVSGVFAADQSDVINIKSVHGGDGIDNIRRTKGDFTQIDIEAFSSKILTAQNIQLKATTPGAAGATFQTCSDMSPYLCTWKSQPGNLPSGAYSYYACIGNCDSCFQDSCKKTATIYVDGTPPSVDSLSADRSMTNGGNVTIHYKITDKSCLAAKCSGHCSGISKAELYDVGSDNSKKLLSTIAIETLQCAVENDYVLSANAMTNGERKLCMMVYDKFVQNSTINSMGPGCIDMKKDDMLPSFIDVRLMDSAEEYDIKYLNNDGRSAKLLVNVSMSEMFTLYGASLGADLSRIGGAKNDKVPCVDLGNGFWSCSKAFTVKVAASGSYDIQLSAIDEGGNNNTQSFSFNFNVDSTAPVVDKITSEHELEGLGYLKGGVTKILAKITETGSGLSQDNVFFDVGGERGIPAACSGSWTCYANASVSGSSASVVVRGKDDAGNPFADTKNLQIDSAPPSIIDVYVRNTNGNLFFVTNDDVLVKAAVDENKGMKDDAGWFDAKLTPVGFADPNPMDAESCEMNASNVWICQWTIMNVAPGKMKMSFNISDFVGNHVSSEKSRFLIEYLDPAIGDYRLMPESLIEVYDVETETADYWEASAGTPMPRYVDSSTTELVEHDVWVPISLSPRSSASVFSVELAGCGGEDYGNYAKEAIIVSPEARSDTPYIRITLNRGAIEVSEMVFNCSLSIVSKHDKKISQAELESVEITIPVYAHGEFSNAVLQEVLRTSNSWLVQGSWIESIGKVIQLVTKICNLLYTIGNVAAIQIGTWAPLANFCEKFPFCYPAAVSAGSTAKATHLGMHGATKGLYKFCQYASCSKTLWGGWLQGKDMSGKPAEKQESSYGKWLQGGGLTGKSEKGINDYLGKITTGKDKTGKEGKVTILGNKPGQSATMTEAERKQRGLDAPSLFGPVQTWGNPQNSLVLSIATGCIPGIFFNLQKARQIDCQYLSCMINNVPSGMPLAACGKVRNFQWCMFIWGEIFQIFPITAILKSITGPMISMLSDPMSMIFGLMGLACQAIPTWGESTTCMAFDAASTVLKLVNQIQEIFNAKDLFNLKGADSCKDTLEKAKSLTSALPGTGIGAQTLNPASV